MKLHIENFAKISHADIEFDGLTVLAGANNTGKVVRFDLDRAWLYKVRGQEIPLQVTLTNLHRAIGLSKAHLKEVEVIEK